MKIKQILGTFDKTKDGVPFIAKASKKPYQKQSVVFAEYGDVIFSIPVFDGKVFKEGDDVKGTAGEIREFNGKKYGAWNFPVSAKKKLELEVAALKAQLAAKNGTDAISEGL